MNIILYILLAVLVLLFMITIHELGHYTAGKILGFKIDEFAIGFGPVIYSKQSKKTGEVFSLRAFPLGGFCAFNGEEGGSDDNGAFTKQAPWKRIIVLFSGAFFNFLAAILFSFILLVSVGYDIPKVYTVNDVSQITNVKILNNATGEYGDTLYNYQTGEFDTAEINQNNQVVKITASISGSDYVLYEFKENDTKYSSAYIPALINDCVNATNKQIPEVDTFDCYATTVDGEKEVKYQFGVILNTNADVLKQGDIVFKVNGYNVDVLTQLPNHIQNLVKQGKSTATLSIRRDGKDMDIEIDILKSGIADKDGNYSYVIGVNTEPYVHNFGEAILRAVPLTFGFSWLVLSTLWQLITGQVAMSAVGGTITTIFVMADYAQQNLKTILVLIPLIAANLAVFNWLPFPALDGSHIVFTGVEWIRKKPLNPKVENAIHTAGLYLLLGFVVFADIYQLILHLIG